MTSRLPVTMASAMSPPLLAVLYLTWLVALDARTTANRLDQLRIACAERNEAYLAGLSLTMWCRCLAVATAGALALWGSEVALTVYVLGVGYQSILSFVQFAAGLRMGCKSKLGWCPPVLPSVAAAVWIGISRALPLYLLRVTVAPP